MYTSNFSIVIAILYRVHIKNWVKNTIYIKCTLKKTIERLRIFSVNLVMF
jgi:hypothetical protein